MASHHLTNRMIMLMEPLTTKINNPTIKAIFSRFPLLLPFVVKDATLISNIEIADVIVAKKNSNKKTMKNNFPNAILLKIAGNTINNSPGP